jgi:hypothetical protein
MDFLMWALDLVINFKKLKNENSFNRLWENGKGH